MGPCEHDDILWFRYGMSNFFAWLRDCWHLEDYSSEFFAWLRDCLHLEKYS